MAFTLNNLDKIVGTAWQSSGVTLTYSFMLPGLPPGQYTNQILQNNFFSTKPFVTVGDVQELRQDQKDDFREAALAWMRVANVFLTEVAPTTDQDLDGTIDGGHIAVGTIPYGPDPRNATAQAATFQVNNGPAGLGTSGDIWLSTRDYMDAQYAGKGEFGYFAMLHELGHALGLKGDDSIGGQNWNQVKYTVMSYRFDMDGPLPSAPMLIDILAIQRHYGANASTATGDNTYRFEVIDSWHVQAIWDAGGNDTIDGSNRTERLTIDLNPGGQSFVGRQGGDRPEIHAAYTPQNPDGTDVASWVTSRAHFIENAIGGSNKDKITGNSKDNQLTGNAGDDEIFGGEGNDTLDGGQDDDRLRGGSGQDRYVFRSGEGKDVIVDLDGGTIEVNGVVLSGSTAQRVIDPAFKNKLSWSMGSGDNAVLLTLVRGTAEAGGTLRIYGPAFGPDNYVEIQEFDLDDNRFGFELRPGNLVRNIEGRLAFNERQSGEYTIQLGGAVGTGGGRVRIDVGATAGNLLRGVNGAEIISFNNGILELLLDEGDSEVSFSLLSVTDIDSPTQFTLSATFLDANGDPQGDAQSINVQLNGAEEASTAAPPTSYTVNGDLNPQLDEDENIIFDQWGNIVPNGSAAGREDLLLDTPGNDLLQGFGGNDHLRAFRGGNDLLDGGTGNDWLEGHDGNDLLLGADGRDLLQTDAGDDTGVGGEGQDVIHGYEGNDQIFGDTIVDLDAAIEAGATGQGSSQYGDFLQGMEGDDVAIGTDARDLLSGGSGKDILVGGAGDDYITGDRSYAADLNGSIGGWNWSISLQIIPGGAPGGGNLYQYTVNDAVSSADAGEDDGDVIHAGGGNDAVLADGGDDTVYGDDGDDVVFGEIGNDTLLGGAGNDLLDGGDPDDPVGQDFLDGGDGDDSLAGSGGRDTLFGGAGNDTLSGDDATEADDDDYLDGEDGNDTVSGGGGNDILYGGLGEDSLYGDSGNTLDELLGDDYLDGGAGNDTILGSGGSDSLVGGEGDDELYGDSSDTDAEFQGNDTLDGGAGNDTLVGDGGADILLGGDDNDQLYGESTGTPEEAHGDDYLDGGAGDDTLVGEGGGDVLIGGDGADRLFGESSSTPVAVQGDDYLDGGAGNDLLVGDGGADTLFGGEGDDELFGESSSTPEAAWGGDILDGGVGDDTLSGGGGDDVLYGSSGFDTLSGGVGNDLLDGGEDDDELFGGSGDDVLEGGAGDDNVFGNDGNDIVDGGGGSDLVSGGLGDDVLSGGDGLDIYGYSLGYGSDTIYDLGSNTLRFDFAFFGSGIQLSLGSLRITFSSSPGDEIHLGDFNPDDPFGTVIVDRFEFTDRVMTLEQLLALGFDVQGTPDSDFLSGTAMNDRINALASDDTVVAKAGDDTIDLGDGNDVALAGAGADTIQGGAGVDLIYGDEGNDTIDGGTGADDMLGGTGNDVYTVDDAGDLVEELVDEGTDIVHSSITYTLTENVENLILTGTDALNGTGNDLNNEITGNSGANLLDGGIGEDTLLAGGGNDTLVGGIGDDTLVGGAGDDTYIVDSSGDVITELAGEGTDVVESNASYTLSENIENLVLTGTADISGVGNALANVITGNSGGNVLMGQGGADTLQGNGGNDVYFIDALDTVVEGVDGGLDVVEADFTYTLTDNVENLILEGTGDINGTGNVLANFIRGNTGNNTLNGLGGADEMRGGLGDDILVVDNAGDIVLELLSEGFDSVESSVTYTLTAGSYIEQFTLTGNAAIDATGNQHGQDIIGNDAGNIISGSTDGLGGADGLFGNGGSDTLYGGGAGDYLDGGADDDYMEGRGGSDIYEVDNVGDVIVEGLNQGIENVNSSVTYTLSANVENLLLYEGAGAIDGTGNDLHNLIEGNESANIISGLSGDDSLGGYAGNDTIDGGEGEDFINGGEGDDALFGGAGHDELRDESGTNDFAGGDGDDTYYVGFTTGYTITENENEGRDTVFSFGSATLSDNVEDLRLQGEPIDYWDANPTPPADGTGNDLDNNIQGSYATNVLRGLGGDDEIDGAAGNDEIEGNDGDDTLYGGDDYYFYYIDWSSESLIDELAPNDDLIFGGLGEDDIDGGSGDDELYGDEGNDTIYGGDDGLVGGGGGEGGYGGGYGFLSNDDFLYGGEGDDVLDGGSGGDELYGGEGVDQLYGGDSGPLNFNDDDVLDGGAGIDYMAGGVGSDWYYVDGTYVDVADPNAVDDCGNPIVGATTRIWTTDTIFENAFEGYDSVVSEASVVLPDNFEAVYLSGTGNLDATAGAGEHELYGNAGNNRLDGGAGSDYFEGGLGDDTFVIGDENDFVSEDEDSGNDTIESSIDYVLGSNLENLTLTGSAVEGTGNQVANRLAGNAGNNILFGLEGNDELNGGAGNDELRGGDGDDVYRFGVGSGVDTVHDVVGLNTVRLLGNLTGADLTVVTSGSDVIVSINGTTDQITLVGWAGVAELLSGNLRLCECGCPVTFNAPPAAVADTANVVEDTVLSAAGNVLTNDSDPDAGTTLTVTDPRTVAGAFGSFTLAVNGSYSFTLDNAAVQSLAAGQTLTEVFNYTITDGHATDPRTDTSTLTITVTGTNDAPVANDDAGSVAEDGTLTASGNVLGNDTDVDQGAVLSVADAGTRNGTYGSLVLASDGSYTYTLDNASALVQSLGQGETENEVFAYTASDGSLTDGAALTIAVAGTNDAPILIAPLADQNGEEGEAFTVTVPEGTFTDIDRNDSLSYTATLADGSALPSWLSFNPTTRQISGTPPTGAAGVYQIRVTATDLFSASANDVFELTIGSSNPEDDTLQFTADICWESGYCSPGGASLDGTEATFGVYDGGAGTDTLLGTSGNDAILLHDDIHPRPVGTSGPRLIGIEIISAGDGDDVVDVSSPIYPYGAVTINGDAGCDVLIGGTGDDTVNGGTGGDDLYGREGNDILDGGTGGDCMTGGVGDDQYYVDNAEDQVYENADEGTDTVFSSISHCLGYNVENLTLVGSAIFGEGNDLDNVITGNAADNILAGGWGTDTLRGGIGNDVYFISKDDYDIVVENAGEGVDEVRSEVSYTLTDNVEKLTLLEHPYGYDTDGTGNALDNIIVGSSACNVIDGGLGADSMTGGGGDDTYIVDNAGDTVTELAGGGDDVVKSSVSFTLSADVERLELQGTANIDATGSATANELIGNAGNNVITGGAGADYLSGGAGSDTYVFSAGFGQDTIEDTTETDEYGLPIQDGGVDVISFDSSISQGDVTFQVGAGSPRDLWINVGASGDRITVENFFWDGAGADHIEQIQFAGGVTLTTADIMSQFSRVFGTNGVDVLNAVSTGSLLYGRDDHDALNGGAGDDVLDGGSGGDTMTGGAGDDSYIVDDKYGDSVIEAAGEGVDTVEAMVDYTLAANVENLTLRGEAYEGIGNGLDNVIRGNDRWNWLDGGAGNDTMAGGESDDWYGVDSANDIVIELEDEGDGDGIDSWVTYSLPDNVEKLHLLGTANIDATGNELGNQLYGNSGNNTLNGGAGDDEMRGYQGNDIYYVDSEWDSTFESSNHGVDTVRSSVSWQLGGNFENLELLGSADIDATGNSLANTLTGNSGANALNGGGGADTMYGGGGDDTYTVNVAGDQAIELAGEGTDTVRSGITFTLGSNVENLTLTGSAAIDAHGNELDNALTGNGGVNLLEGGAGNDVLNGGGNIDTMIGGTGDDVYHQNVADDVVTELAGEGFDTVSSSVGGAMAANIEALFQTGGSSIHATDNALDNLMRGNNGSNQLTAGDGIDILEGGAGNDTLTDTSGNALLNGQDGSDTLNGTSLADVLIGGHGNDIINAGTGADVILFNRGDGRDTVNPTTGLDNTLSLGGGIAYSDLVFRKSGNNLILQTGTDEQLTFVNWYASTDNRNIDTLQMLIEGTSDYNAGSSDPMLNAIFQSFDFEGLVAAFDAARVATPGLTSWSLTSALATFHLGASDTSAIGSDFAYEYGRTGTLAGISFSAATGLLTAPGFGSTSQPLHTPADLINATPRLS